MPKYISKLRGIFFVALAFLVSSCSMYPAGFEVITSDKQKTPIVWNGLQFLPPQNGNWFVNKNDTPPRFVKSDSLTHTYVARVYYATAPKFKNVNELAESTRPQWQLNADSERFDVDKYEVIPDNKFGDFSVRHFKRYKDKGAPNKIGTPYLILEEYGYAFIHPYNPDLMVVVFYSERFTSGEQTKASIIEREQFINNVKITPYRKNNN
jgi:hypothetical protein